MTKNNAMTIRKLGEIIVETTKNMDDKPAEYGTAKDWDDEMQRTFGPEMCALMDAICHYYNGNYAQAREAVGYAMAGIMDE